MAKCPNFNFKDMLTFSFKSTGRPNCPTMTKQGYLVRKCGIMKKVNAVDIVMFTLFRWFALSRLVPLCVPLSSCELRENWNSQIIQWHTPTHTHPHRVYADCVRSMRMTYFSVLLRGLPQPFTSTHQMDPSPPTQCVFFLGSGMLLASYSNHFEWFCITSFTGESSGNGITPHCHEGV